MNGSAGYRAPSPLEPFAGGPVIMVVSFAGSRILLGKGKSGGDGVGAFLPESETFHRVHDSGRLPVRRKHYILPEELLVRHLDRYRKVW